MSFDSLVRFYAALETMVFGRALWHARIRYLDEIRRTTKVLVLGDGDGRFTAALATSAPETTIVSLDSSAAMLLAARSRLSSSARGRVRFVCGDAKRMPLHPELLKSCDAIVSHFLLDCLEQSETDTLARMLAERTSDRCIWLISEFAIPERQPWRWGGRWLVWVLYWFTGRITGLAVNQLPDYAASLTQAGFECKLLDKRLKGLLRSEIWELCGDKTRAA